MLDTIFEYTEEVESLRNMSSKAALLIEETNRANSALNEKMSRLKSRLLAIRDKQAPADRSSAEDANSGNSNTDIRQAKLELD